MMGKKNDGHLIRKKLEQLPVEVDQDLLWDAIEKELPKRKKRFLFLWFYIGLLFTFGSVYGFYTSRKPLDIPIDRFPIVVPQEIKKIEFKENATHGKSTKTTEPIAQISQMVSKHEQQLKNDEKNDENPQSIQPNYGQLKISQEVNREGKSPISSFLTTLAYLKQTVDPLEWHRAEDHYFSSVPKIVQNGKLYGVLYQGFGKFSSNFKLLETTAADQVAARQQTEVPLEALTSGFLVGWQFNQYWFIEFGLERQQLNTRLNGSFQELETLLAEHDSAYVYLNALNEETFISGEVEISRRTNYDVELYNQSVLYNAILQTGYQKHWGRWGMRIMAAALFNGRHRFSGDMIGPEGQLLREDQIRQANWYKTSLGLGYQGSMEANFKLNYHSSLGLELAHRRFNSSLVRSKSVAYEQKISQNFVQLRYAHTLY
ncbi:MAG: hypothetical protein AAF705_00830 [Bacteroidota bacterium]